MKHLLTRCALAVLFLFVASCDECKVDGDCDTAAGEICDNGACVPGSGNPVCGNNAVETGEQCDPPDNVTCDANCQTIIVPPNCGDGVIQAGDGEQCDPPDNVTCDAGCHIINAVCGNGVLEGNEECDDGNQVDTDTCHNNCTSVVAGGCPGPDPNLGLAGAVCATSEDCCQPLGVGCLDTDGDAVGDHCGTDGCALCGNGTPCECCDGINNEDPNNTAAFDDLIDDADPQCLGPTDDDETNFSTGIPGDNNGANGATECPFDGNSGVGNDDLCAGAIPSGCDCKGCCQIDLNNNGTNDVFAVDANGNPVDANADGVNDGCAFVANTTCTVTPLNNNFGTAGGPCNVDADCGPNPVDPNLQMTCEIDGDGVTKYCSTCVGSSFEFNTANCVNTCVCCEACAGTQTAECDPDPALAGVDVGVEGNDGDADTINDCGGATVCQSAVACQSDNDCNTANGETCDIAAGFCLLDTCAVNTDCVAPLICDTFQGGCCVFIP